MTNIDDLFRQTLEPRTMGDVCELQVPIAFLSDLNNSTSRAEILGVYSVWAQRLVQADRCSIALSDGEGSLVITAMNGTKGIPAGTNHPVKNTVVGHVFARRELLFLPDVAAIDFPDAEVVRTLGYSSAVIAPIVAGDACFGAFSASFKCPLATPEKTLAMMQAMARCLATQLLVIEQMETLSNMVVTDPLTGARNRRFLYDEATALWEEWTRHMTPFSFLSIDIDHFKRINDNHGHDVGDAVLCAIVKRLQSRSRSTDRIVRMGGEEFGVLLCSSGLDDALPRARRLHDVIGHEHVGFEALRLPVTASMGVASVNHDDHGFDDVLKRADRALYQAKADGRSRIVMAKGEALVAV